MPESGSPKMTQAAAQRALSAASDESVIVLADDLTGAMDSGLQFRAAGLSTAVILKADRAPTTSVVVHNLSTRACSASQARHRILDLAVALRHRRLYKKVDSTLRGNIGYELRALYEALDIAAFIFAPAFPQQGRITRWGEQRVDGKPLDQTSFAHDPRWPMHEAHIPTLLMRQSGLDTIQIGLAQVERGADALAERLRIQEAQILIVDATHEEHLSEIAQATLLLGPHWVPCGSAGLAEAWAAHLARDRHDRLPQRERSSAPCLTISGSRNERTLLQLDALCRRTNTQHVSLHSRDCYQPKQEIDRLYKACCQALDRGYDLLLEASTAPLLPGGAERIAEILAAVTRQLVNSHRLCGLSLTGGDIAVAVCQILGAEAIEIAAAVQPGIPGGRVLGGLAHGLGLVTKAGGFGDEQALIDAKRWLRDTTPKGENPS